MLLFVDIITFGILYLITFLLIVFVLKFKKYFCLGILSYESDYTY